MRFEVAAAYIVGLLLPVAETVRRRTDFSDIPRYVDDFIIGTLLIIAAWMVTRRRAAGPILLVLAWGAFCGGMYFSFFGQLSHSATRDESGLPASAIIAVKGALYLVGAVAAVQSVRAAVPKEPG
jgi:hypothetical protein